jgi:hypothetical protein
MPRAGWLRGYRVVVVDRDGRPLPKALLHHAEMVDLDRRDLLRPALNRIVSAGRETAAMLLPPGLGYPVAAGHQLGINAMLSNPTDTEYREAFVQALITVTPEGTPGVRPIMNLYAETSYDSTGDSDFDLPPGETRKVVEFTIPVSGQVLAVGGHLHDYGTRLVVVRAGADTLYDARPNLDATGAVAGMPTRPMFGQLMRIAAGDRFLMTVTYDNTSGRLLEGAGMGTFGLVFRPDDLAQWPALDRQDPGVRRDLAQLRTPAQHQMHPGMDMGDMRH